MAKTGKSNGKKSIADLLKGENIARLARLAVRDALKENLKLGVAIPVSDANGKVVYLKPEKVFKK